MKQTMKLRFQTIESEVKMKKVVLFVAALSQSYIPK